MSSSSSFLLTLALTLCGSCQVPPSGAAPAKPDPPAAKKAEQPAEPKPADEEKDWSKIRGVEKFRREFLIRRDNAVAGRCAFTVRSFQDGAILRTGLEYWIFRGATDPGREHFWFEGYVSEHGPGGAIAEWATGNEGGLSMKYRIKGAGGGRARFDGNLFDVGHRNPKTITLPEGYKLLQAFASQLTKAASRSPGESFTWKRYIWREWEPTWHDYRYTYEGPDTVMSVGRVSFAAHRFKIEAIGVRAPGEMLWIDKDGYPLRRVIRTPGGRPWEMIVTKDPPGDMSKFFSWGDIRRDHEAEAKTFLRSIGTWY